MRYQAALHPVAARRGRRDLPSGRSPWPGICTIPSSERVTGIEPAPSAWKAEVLPLNYTRRHTTPLGSPRCRLRLGLYRTSRTECQSGTPDFSGATLDHRPDAPAAAIHLVILITESVIVERYHRAVAPDDLEQHLFTEPPADQRPERMQHAAGDTRGPGVTPWVRQRSHCRSPFARYRNRLQISVFRYRVACYDPFCRTGVSGKGAVSVRRRCTRPRSSERVPEGVTGRSAGVDDVCAR